MIAAFVSPIRGDLMAIRTVTLPRIDAKAVHFGAIFMKGVVNMYLLNAACDFPVPRSNVSERRTLLFYQYFCKDFSMTVETRSMLIGLKSYFNKSSSLLIGLT